jgi:large subunit ribosomal protein L6
LELVGVGFKASVSGQNITLALGFSHPIVFPLPQGVSATVEKNTLITLTGINIEDVGNSAASVRALRKPEPYQGKGVKYVGEVIRRKLGKAAKAAGAGA